MNKPHIRRMSIYDGSICVAFVWSVWRTKNALYPVFAHHDLKRVLDKTKEITEKRT